MRNCKHPIVALCLLAGTIVASDVAAQARVRIPATSQGAQGAANPASRNFGVSQPNTAPAIPGTSSLGQPAFDPYATAPGAVPNAASSPPTLWGGSPAVPGAGVGVSPYDSATPTPGWPAPATTIPGNTYPSTGYPATYPQQPSVMFPDGLGLNQCWPMTYAQQGPYMRLFQEVRIVHTWLAGGEGPQELGINETELATTINFPNFFWSGQPLHVSPVFMMHWWDGPDTVRFQFPTDSPPPGPFGLPPRAYSAYLDFAWKPYLTQQLSADLDVSIGVYTDFDGITADSVRIQGTGLGVLALTPTVTLKAGVTYLDRVDVKLLPAGGILWTPNPQTRWDIYFPRPKLAHYLTTLGNTDVWVYVNGEYGGGSWTIGSEAVDRRMDINDIRVGGGFEWTHQFGLHGFAEAAYVFDRELVFAADGTRWPLKDTVMVRGGLAY